MQPIEFVRYLISEDGIWDDKIDVNEYDIGTLRKLLIDTDQYKNIGYALTNMNSESNLLRKQAAKLIHLYIKYVLLMPDVVEQRSLKKAKELKDLYDCRICVDDIVQVCAREIMLPMYDVKEIGVRIFGSNEILSDKEAEEIKKRIRNMKS